MFPAKLKPVLWVLLVLALALSWYPYAPEPVSPGAMPGFDTSQTEALADLAGVAVTLLLVVCLLDLVVEPLQRHRPTADYVIAGWTALSVFGCTLLAVHYLASVPTWLTAIAASPCVAVPLALERLRHPFERDQESKGSLRVLPAFQFDEEVNIFERALVSDVAKVFLARYPKCRVYVYQEPTRDGRGGLCLANRERMNLPGGVLLDVVLICPFGPKPGDLLLGQERIRTYFYRPGVGGSYFSFLATLRWEDWLVGRTELNWFVKIRGVYKASRSKLVLGDLPYPIVSGAWRWKELDLRPHRFDVA